MQITGIVEKVLPVVTGVNARGEWKRQMVVVKEDAPIPYPDSFVITFMGDNVQKLQGVLPGQKVNVIWSAWARMYNNAKGEEAWSNENRGAEILPLSPSPFPRPGKGE